MNDSFARYRPYLAMMLLFLIALAGTIFLLRRPEQPVIAIATATPRPTAIPALIIVQVRGAVAKPGVYTLPAGSRVQDVIALAGEVTSSAETRALNLARKVNDGEQLYIPAIGEAAPTSAPAASKTTPSAAPSPTGKINLNTATSAELDMLPGIGPALAQRIIEYRATSGAFQKSEDLKKVRGIGDALFEQIKDLVTTE